MVKRYILNLDLSAENRWLHILNDYKQKIPELKLHVDKIFENLNLGYFSKNFLYYLIRFFELSGYMIYSDELRIFSNYTGIEIEKIVFMQLYYEMAASYTTLITNVNNQPIFLGATDWDSELLKDLTIELDVQKNNKTIFIATTWICCAGFHTISLPNKYSLSINHRGSHNINSKSLLYDIFRMMTKYWPASYLLRYIAEKNLDELELHNILSHAYLISPSYITVCYHNINKKPAIYIRNIYDLEKIHTDDYIVLTSCDYDNSGPSVLPTQSILYNTPRRNLANKIILGNNNNFTSVKKLYESFSTYPILNDKTIYTILITHEDNNINYQTIVNK